MVTPTKQPDSRVLWAGICSLGRPTACAGAEAEDLRKFYRIIASDERNTVVLKRTQ